MGIKIGQIARQSGVPTSTIRYYVKEGLLPAPVKLNKKMSHYDEGCVDRLRTIQRLQEKRFPLGVIRNILQRVDAGLPLEEAEAVEDLIFGAGDSAAGQLVDQEGFLERTGLTRAELAELERVGLLMPASKEKGRPLYDHEDILVGKSVFKKLFALTLTTGEIGFYVTLGKKIIEHELDLRKKITQGKSVKDNLRITVDLTNAANLIRGYVLRRLFRMRIQENIQKGSKRSRRV